MLTRLVGMVVAGLLLTPARATFAQSTPSAALEAVERAIGGGDVDALITHSSDQIEVAVFGRSRLYSRAHARYILADFFEQHPPRGFAFREPSTTSKGLFVEGSYRHATGEEPMRVYAQLRKVDSDWLVREILIERPVRERRDAR